MFQRLVQSGGDYTVSINVQERTVSVRNYKSNTRKSIGLLSTPLCFDPLKTKPVYFVQGLRAYRAVNTFHFGYTKPIS
jgi:hypothetical protein